MGPSDPRKRDSKQNNDSTLKGVAKTLEELPDLVRRSVALRVETDVKSVSDQLASLKEYFDGLEKTNIALLKWKNQGLLSYRDDLVGMRWAEAVLDLNNSDNSTSFEKLVSTCFWCCHAFNSAARQDNVRRFLGEYF